MFVRLYAPPKLSVLEHGVWPGRFDRMKENQAVCRAQRLGQLASEASQPNSWYHVAPLAP